MSKSGGPNPNVAAQFLFLRALLQAASIKFSLGYSVIGIGQSGCGMEASAIARLNVVTSFAGSRGVTKQNFFIVLNCKESKSFFDSGIISTNGKGAAVAPR